VTNFRIWRKLLVFLCCPTSGLEVSGDSGTWGVDRMGKDEWAGPPGRLAACLRSNKPVLQSNRDLRVLPAGRWELAAGQAGTRLLSAIGAMATPYHVDITGFGAPAAGAIPGVPLRSADISLTLPCRGRDAATLNCVKRFLLAQQAPFRPADVTTVRLAGGQAVPHVEFTAPSPFGLLGALN
jgi:hypothetical protein